MWLCGEGGTVVDVSASGWHWSVSEWSRRICLKRWGLGESGVPAGASGTEAGKGKMRQGEARPDQAREGKARQVYASQ